MPQDSAKTPDLPAKTRQVLTPKQLRFVDCYVKSLNQTQAALEAGYSPASARQAGTANMSVPAIRELVDAKLQALKDQNALSPKRVLEELRRLAFMDYGQLYDPETGIPIPIHKLPIEARAAISGVESVQYNSDPGDGKRDNATKTRIRTWSKDKALELLAKHFGLVDDRVEHSGTLVIRHELAPPTDSPTASTSPQIAQPQPLSLNPPEPLESAPVRVSGSRMRVGDVVDVDPLPAPEADPPNG